MATSIDFNNLRKQAAYALDRVTKTLNSGLLPEQEYYFEMDNGKVVKTYTGDVLVDRSDLQKDMDELRQCVWVLLCCYEENNPNYAAVFEEVEQSGGLARFNDEDD